MQTEWMIGRIPPADIIVPDPSVSSRHCRLFRREDKWFVEDLGSSNGTFVNGKRITEATLVTVSDCVTLGLSARMPWPQELVDSVSADRKRGSAGPQPTLVFKGDELTVGRDPSCGHVFDYPMVSRRHARLRKSRKSVTIEDLGSANGTFVNGHRITGVTALNVGDVVELGSYELRLNADGLLEETDLRGKMTVEVRSVSLVVPGRKLLADVSLTIQPGEFVGLMGPAGAGKTTLMSAMNGYLQPNQGDVLFNGESLYGNYSQFATRIGYVPQDDIMHRDLTVSEALYYTARLRLPDDYSRTDILDRIELLLEQLGLAGVEDVLIGSPEKKGISGGQRKRVNLAMELLTDPLVLFLDEPTSGLSSEDALVVMKLLRSLADSGKTILLTIHQPGLEVFRLLDNLAIVSKDKGSVEPGRLVYYGPAYPAAVDFFNPTASWPKGVDPSPDEVLRGLGAKPTEDWLGIYTRSDHYSEYVARRATAVPKPNRSTESMKASSPPGGTFRQWVTLLRRCLSIKKRDTLNTLILLAQAPIVACLVALTFGKPASQDISDLESWKKVAETILFALFIMVLSGLWFGCSNSVREIVGEWAIYRRERMVNLRIPAYVGSKFAVLCSLSVVQCLILLAIVAWGCDLKGPPVIEFLTLLLVSWIGVGIGLVVSAAARTSEAAVALLPIALLPMVMLGGVMMPVHEMQSIARPLANAMPSRWGFEALLVAESQEQPPQPALPNYLGIPATSKDDETGTAADMAEHSFPMNKERTGVVVPLAVMLLMFVSLYGATHFILWRRDLH